MPPPSVRLIRQLWCVGCDERAPERAKRGGASRGVVARLQPVHALSVARCAPSLAAVLLPLFVVAASSSSTTIAEHHSTRETSRWLHLTALCSFVFTQIAQLSS